MAIFLVFYKLFLENESMHVFKRYFQLAAIAISLVIPAVVFTEVVYIAPISTSFALTEDYSLETYHTPSIESIDYTYWSLLSIYSLGVLFFSLQFFKNLYHIKNTIQHNPKQQTNRIIKVLLSLQIVPHTFFNYIFLNKQKFEANEIPSAVLLHEETHAKQKHSIDILVIEILQIVLWFNPLIYLFKKSIKLNHEFLADSAVLNNGLEKSDYQKILLAFSSNAAEPQLANAINYSSIKKRFTVMKKETSKKVSLIKSLLIIPIAAILLLGFSEKEILEIQKEGTPQEQQTLLNGIQKELENVDALKLNYTEEKEQIIELYIKKNSEILIQNTPVLLKDLAVAIEKEIQPDIKLENVRVEGLTEDTLESEFMFSITTEIRKANIKHIKFCTSEYKMNAEDYKENINITPETVILQTDNIVLQHNKISEYNTLAKKYNAIPIEKRVIPLKDLKVLETIYRSLSAEQKAQVLPFPECLPKHGQQKSSKEITININDKGALLVNGYIVELKNLSNFLARYNTNISMEDRKKTISSYVIITPKSPKGIIKKVEEILTDYGVATIDLLGNDDPSSLNQQKNASPKQVSQYNVLAKKYNKMLGKNGSVRILKSDVDQLTYIFGIMSDKQKESAQPFPDFPEPPPAPIVPKAPNTTDYADAEINRVIKTQDPYDHNNLDLKAVNGNPATTNTFYSGSDIENTRVYIYNSSSSKLDNSPSLMKNLRSLEKQDAQFFFDGKKITSEEGFQIIKNETNIKVETLPYTNKQPEVRIYKENNDLRIPPPPAPPTPPSPLDYVINAAKKGATFIYEGDKVSSDKAIDLLKNNKELNIESRNKNGKQIVLITKDPVTIE